MSQIPQKKLKRKEKQNGTKRTRHRVDPKHPGSTPKHKRNILCKTRVDPRPPGSTHKQESTIKPTGRVDPTAPGSTHNVPTHSDGVDPTAPGSTHGSFIINILLFFNHMIMHFFIIRNHHAKLALKQDITHLNVG